MGRVRLDKEIVRRKLARSRAEAEELVRSGTVLVSGSVAVKPSRLVSSEEPIVVTAPGPRYVSRGGLKLEFALSRFDIDVAGKVCLDVGASAGGFTDCLLRHGARRVYAVDVGRAQLHSRLACDPRVVSLESTDARSLTPEIVPEPCEIVTVDVSFIGVAKVVPSLLPLASPRARFVVLVKPQFEAGRGAVPRGGVVRDPQVHRQVLLGVRKSLEEAGLCLEGVDFSPILGAEGNVEYVSSWRFSS